MKKKTINLRSNVSAARTRTAAEVGAAIHKAIERILRTLPIKKSNKHYRVSTLIAPPLTPYLKAYAEIVGNVPRSCSDGTIVFKAKKWSRF